MFEGNDGGNAHSDSKPPDANASNRSMVDHALALAARGLPVFPLLEGETTPRDKGFFQFATTDPSEVRRLWGGARGKWNVGVSTGNGLVGVDVDVKGGKAGLPSLELSGLPTNTFTTRTRSGGLHLYFRARDYVRNGVDVLGPGSGLDVRGHHGFLVGPGSVTADGSYEIINDAPLVELTADQLLLFKSARSERTRRQDVPDDDAARLAASEFLIRAPGAIQGQGGNSATYKLACDVRDFGVCEATCLDLMLNEWNFKSVPEWPAEELATVVRNAYNYAVGDGTDSYPESPGPIEIAPIDQGESLVHWADEIDDESPRVWLLKNILPRPGVGLLYGPAKAGKSFVAMDLACHVALGRSWFGQRPLKQPVGVLFLLGEGSGTMRERLTAFQRKFEVERFPMAWATVDNLAAQGWAAAQRKIDEAVKGFAARGVELGLVIIDTIASAMGIEDENDASAVTRAMKRIEQISMERNCAVLGLHHANKAGDDRGSTAFRAACDVMMHVDRVPSAATIPEGLRKISVKFNRNGREDWQARFMLETVDLGRDEDGDPITCCVVANDFHGQPIDQALNAIVSIPIFVREQLQPEMVQLHGKRLPSGETGIALRDVQEACGSMFPEKRLDARRQAVKREVDKLAAEGSIRKQTVGRQVYYLSGAPQ